ncbi:basic proline-rich protein-like [Phocoena sinus]|uniref:basic proline-rich protein-like n=1 Tax=Phocoena sinus TaxID=42100 RepID=UPI0013C4D353|nr:basic proline-rich protein-like [Phocoena sinus]
MAGGGGGWASDSQCGSGRAGRICGREGAAVRVGPRTSSGPLAGPGPAPPPQCPGPPAGHPQTLQPPRARPGLAADPADGFAFGLLFPFSLEQPCTGPARGGILPRRLRSRPFGPRERRAGVVAQGSELKLGELSLSDTSARPPGKGDLGPEVLRAAPGSPSPSCLGDPAASPGVGTLSQPHLRALPAPQLPMPADPCWLAPSPAGFPCRPLTEGPEEPGGMSEIRSLFIPAVLKATAPRNPPPHNALQNGTHFGT